jgi:hypothetical protein
MRETRGWDDLRAQVLETRMAQLEERIAHDAGPSVQVPPRADDASPEDETAAEERRHAKWVQRYESERADPAFSATAARSLRTDLRPLAEAAGFQITDVDCRTTMCAAKLEWPTFAGVRQAARDLVIHTYHTNCAKELHFPPPEDPTQPYGATLFFDCESFRASQ